MANVTAYYHSPIGWLSITGNEKVIVDIHFLKQKPSSTPHEIPHLVKDCILQLDEYFTSKRKKFTLPLINQGSDFQREIMRLVTKVPFGKVSTYGDIAEQLGNANASRAVGNANAKNCLPILIPCHRIIGANEKLTGYAGGMEKKKWLLKHEGSLKQLKLF